MSSVGEILRSERERQGLELPKVCAQTRIGLKYLAAIEADEPGGLPGNFFYRSFVHQYADFLGVDHEVLDGELERLSPLAGSIQMDRFIERVDVPPLPPEGRSSTPNRLPLALVLLVTAIIASSAIYAVWQRAQQPAETRTEVPAAAASKPAPVAAEQPKPAALVQPVNPQPAPVTQQSPSTAPPPPAPQQAATQPAAPAAPGKGARLEFMATEEVWVSATVDGKEVIKRVLKPGETRTIQGDNLSLLTGNAGGLIVTANGKLLDQIGPRGQVRIVEVTPQGAEVRGPLPKKPPPSEP